VFFLDLENGSVAQEDTTAMRINASFASGSERRWWMLKVNRGIIVVLTAACSDHIF
jgi:hypothetical protein